MRIGVEEDATDDVVVEKAHLEGAKEAVYICLTAEKKVRDSEARRPASQGVALRKSIVNKEENKEQSGSAGKLPSPQHRLLACWSYWALLLNGRLIAFPANAIAEHG